MAGILIPLVSVRMISSLSRVDTRVEPSEPLPIVGRGTEGSLFPESTVLHFSSNFSSTISLWAS